MVAILLLLAHITVSLVLILAVLLQTGKRADLAGAFGGGGSQTAFGARGAATFLSKATTWSAITFMATSILLGVYFGRESSSSVVSDTASRPAPAAPAMPMPQPVPVPVGIPAGGSSPSPAAPSAATPAEPNAPAPADAQKKAPPPSPAPAGSK